MVEWPCWSAIRKLELLPIASRALGEGATHNDDYVGFLVLVTDADTQVFQRCPVCSGTSRSRRHHTVPATLGQQRRNALRKAPRQNMFYFAKPEERQAVRCQKSDP